MSELPPENPDSQQKTPLINPDLKTLHSLPHLTSALRKTMELANSVAPEKPESAGEVASKNTDNDSPIVDTPENK